MLQQHRSSRSTRSEMAQLLESGKAPVALLPWLALCAAALLITRALALAVQLLFQAGSSVVKHWRLCLHCPFTFADRLRLCCGTQAAAAQVQQGAPCPLAWCPPIASPPMVQSLACRETIEEIAEYLEDCASELDYELQQQQQAVQVRSLFYDMQSSVQ